MGERETKKLNWFAFHFVFIFFRTEELNKYYDPFVIKAEEISWLTDNDKGKFQLYMHVGGKFGCCTDFSFGSWTPTCMNCCLIKVGILCTKHVLISNRHLVATYLKCYCLYWKTWWFVVGENHLLYKCTRNQSPCDHKHFFYTMTKKNSSQIQFNVSFRIRGIKVIFMEHPEKYFRIDRWLSQSFEKEIKS